MPSSELGLTYASYKSNAVLTASMQTWLKDYAVDQIFNGSAMIRWMTGRDVDPDIALDAVQASGALELRDGGQSIDIPLLTAKSTAIQSYHGYQQLDTTAQQGIGPCFVDWREYAATISISKFEELTNMDSRTRVINLLKTKTRQAESSIRDRIAQDIWRGDLGAGAAKRNTTDLEGVSYYITEDPTTGTIANINRATAGNEFWRNQFNGTSQSVTSTGPSFSAEGKQDILLLSLDAAAGPGADEVDAYFTTKTVYSYLWDSLEDMRRYTSSTADAGYTTMTFMGKPVYWDLNCPASNLYGLNKNYWHMVVHRDAFFATDGWRQPTNQTARVAVILFMGNLITSNPRRSFVLHDLAA